MKLGKSKFSNERKSIFKIKDGDNIYRILPPMGNLADAGVYSRYFRVVWGYKDSKGNNRPFVSPRVQNFNTKMIEVDCAAFNRSQKLKEVKKELGDLSKSLTEQAKGLAAGGQPLPEDLKLKLSQTEEALKEANDNIKRFNIESKHHLNAMTKDGKIGLLKLAGRGMSALRAEFKSLEASGVDATGVDNGRFMNIQRSGTGLDTVYTVKELKEKVNTEQYGLVEKPLPHNLDESIINRLAGEAFELDEVYPSPSEEDVKKIVEAYERSESEGSLMVDQVLGQRDSAPAKNNSQAETKLEQRNEVVSEAPTTNVVEQVTETTVETVVENKTVVANTETGEIISETPIVNETIEAPAATAAVNPAAQSDADFLADLGVKL